MTESASRRAFALFVAAAAVGLTYAFFAPLWHGGGLVGGDVITYFLPQKTFLAESLAGGDIPLWNPTVALGYPFVADSQIALWYPTTIPLHLSVRPETALHINLLLHYAFAFIGTVLLARRLRVARGGAVLAALAFVYGWFPPRLTVEWAVTTGSYLPWLLWAGESYLSTRRPRWLAVLATLAGLQLLAGHYSLAFISHITLGVWTACRLTYARRADEPHAGRGRVVAFVLAAQVLAFPLAACQLLPTWELRQQSERGGLPIPDVDYGRIPWQHLSQLVWPPAAWEGNVNAYGGADTNPPAASLYVGVLAVLLAVIGGFIGRERRDRVWWILVPTALVFAVGWATPVYQHLPGFGYFKIPGRYGIVAALGLSLLAGRGLTAIVDSRFSGPQTDRRHRIGALVITGTAVAILAVDLRVHAARGPFFTELVPIHSGDLIAKSTARAELLADLGVPPAGEPGVTRGGPPRVWCPGQNTLASLGIAVVPGFVGLPPDAYVDPDTALPVGADPAGPTGDQLSRARRYGVTHVFFDEQPDFAAWNCDPVGVLTDPFLSLTMNRMDWDTQAFRPFYVGRLRGSRGRAAMADGRGASITRYTPDRVEVEATGPGELILTDLAYPGWEVTIDAEPVTADSAGGETADRVLRSVRLPDGPHVVVWSYRPSGVRIGWLVSAVTAVAVFVILVASQRRRRRDTKAAPTVAEDHRAQEK